MRQSLRRKKTKVSSGRKGRTEKHQTDISVKSINYHTNYYNAKFSGWERPERDWRILAKLAYPMNKMSGLSDWSLGLRNLYGTRASIKYFNAMFSDGQKVLVNISYI